MEESRTRKYIITEMNLPEFKQKSDAAYPGKANHIAWLDKEIIPGAFYLECLWFFEGSGTNRVEAHTHDFDEVIAFFGSDPQNPNDLGAVAEVRIGDEVHTVTKSCLIFVPKGLKHGPIDFKKIDRPIIHFACGIAEKYF